MTATGCAHTQELLAEDGFEGFATFEALRRRDVSVPASAGVYVVVLPRLRSPKFLSTGTGGRFKGRDPNVSVEMLRDRWVTGCAIVYLGKATNLRARLRQFADFGAGKPIGHWGGRHVWQLDGADRLLVAWKTADDASPREMELELLARFRAAHGRLPFANLVN